MNKEIESIIRHYQFDTIPVEGTLYKSTYVSTSINKDQPAGTAIIGLYAHQPKSFSTFHRLTRDEVWHFYKGAAFWLHLIYPNGDYQKIVMGTDIFKGEKLQFVVPANVWQAGEISTSGKYALFGCTLAPGFTGDCFEGGNTDLLLQKYSQHARIIQRLGVRDHGTQMPIGFQQ